MDRARVAVTSRPSSAGAGLTLAGQQWRAVSPPTCTGYRWRCTLVAGEENPDTGQKKENGVIHLIVSPKFRSRDENEMRVTRLSLTE